MITGIEYAIESFNKIRESLACLQLMMLETRNYLIDALDDRQNEGIDKKWRLAEHSYTESIECLELSLQESVVALDVAKNIYIDAIDAVDEDYSIAEL